MVEDARLNPTDRVEKIQSENIQNSRNWLTQNTEKKRKISNPYFFLQRGNGVAWPIFCSFLRKRNAANIKYGHSFNSTKLVLIFCPKDSEIKRQPRPRIAGKKKEKRAACVCVCVMVIRVKSTPRKFPTFKDNISICYFFPLLFFFN